MCQSKAGLWSQEPVFWVLISATNILPCLVALANDVSLKTASVYPFVHCRLGPGNGCPLEAPFKVPGVGATPRTTNVDLDKIHSGSPTLVQNGDLQMSGCTSLDGQVHHGVLCQVSSRLGRGSKGLRPHGSEDFCQCPAGHISIQKPSGICRQSRRDLTPECSRELVGCKKSSMEAGSILAMESMGSRSLSRKATGPENPPKIWSCWGRRDSWYGGRVA